MEFILLFLFIFMASDNVLAKLNLLIFIGLVAHRRQEKMIIILT